MPPASPMQARDARGSATNAIPVQRRAFGALGDARQRRPLLLVMMEQERRPVHLWWRCCTVGYD